MVSLCPVCSDGENENVVKLGSVFCFFLKLKKTLATRLCSDRGWVGPVRRLPRVSAFRALRCEQWAGLGRRLGQLCPAVKYTLPVWEGTLSH